MTIVTYTGECGICSKKGQQLQVVYWKMPADMAFTMLMSCHECLATAYALPEALYLEHEDGPEAAT